MEPTEVPQKILAFKSVGRPGRRRRRRRRRIPSE